MHTGQQGGGRDEVDAVRPRKVPGRASRDAGVAVLPDDAVGTRVDDDHAVVEVVVEEEIAVGKRQCERRVIELRVASTRPVTPAKMAVTVEGLEDSRGLPADRDVE